MKTPVTIIIPTFNNPEFLQPCLSSMLWNNSLDGMARVIVVNNGDPKSCDWIDHKLVKVINTGKNLGWEGGLKEGLKHTKSDFIVFSNDDVHVPTQSFLWLRRLIANFTDPSVAAAGPSSNVVMGLQNIFVNCPKVIFPTKYLIGFCMMVRRSALEEVGGVDDTLPGGDDLDLSIRFRKAGYKILTDRTVFIYHHGFKTGNRVKGDSSKRDGWNSIEMQEKTNFALIKKHGFKSWVDCIVGGEDVGDTEEPNYEEDKEGKMIKDLIFGDNIVELGCGAQKTVPTAIGIDIVPAGEQIYSIGKDSIADVVSDISGDLPLEENSVSTMIARHVLEHLLDPLEALRSWKKYIYGGLILAVPDEDRIKSIPMNVEHVHAFNKKSLANLVRAAGYVVQQQLDVDNGVSFITICVPR